LTAKPDEVVEGEGAVVTPAPTEEKKEPKKEVKKE